jgi:hypothetical protein
VVWLTIREADLGVRFLGLSSQQQQITTDPVVAHPAGPVEGDDETQGG